MIISWPLFLFFLGPFRGQPASCELEVFCPVHNSALHFAQPDAAASSRDTGMPFDSWLCSGSTPPAFGNVLGALVLELLYLEMQSYDLTLQTPENPATYVGFPRPPVPVSHELAVGAPSCTWCSLFPSERPMRRLDPPPVTIAPGGDASCAEVLSETLQPAAALTTATGAGAGGCTAARASFRGVSVGSKGEYPPQRSSPLASPAIVFVAFPGLCFFFLPSRV